MDIILIWKKMVMRSYQIIHRWSVRPQIMHTIHACILALRQYLFLHPLIFILTPCLQGVCHRAGRNERAKINLCSIKVQSIDDTESNKVKLHTVHLLNIFGVCA